MTTERRYPGVDKLQSGIGDWCASLLHDELALFEDLAELILHGIGTIPTRGEGASGEQATVVTMLMGRMFDDFEACKRLLLCGLNDQYHMPLRDAAECSGLIAIFLMDDEKALRWVRRLAEYQPKDVRAILDADGVHLISSDYYAALSHFAHPNLLSVVDSITETDLGRRTLLREFHLGGWQNEVRIRADMHFLLGMMYLMLHECVPNVIAAYDGDAKEFHEQVKKLYDCFEPLGIRTEIDSAETGRAATAEDERISERVEKRLKIRSARYGPRS